MSTTVHKPRFSKKPEDRQHYNELRRLVNSRLEELPRGRLVIARFRAVVLPMVYFLLYFLALNQKESIGLFYLLYFLMGITAVLIFLNVIHESCHGNLFRAAFWNRAFYSFFDIMGMNSYIWEKRHNHLHHHFPNMAGWDSDIEQSSIIKIYPHENPKPIQRYQQFFFFLLYPLYLINWVIVRDFKDYLNKNQIVRKICHTPLSEWIKLLPFKAFFFFYIFLVPWKIVGFTLGQSIIALMIMLGGAGIFALAVLLTPHVNTGNAFPLTDSQLLSSDSWLMHQFITTNDVTTENFITRNLMGNFNYHTAHHLFPNISCVYAPEVTAVIREYARDHQLPYHAYPFLVALKKHYELLKSNAGA